MATFQIGELDSVVELFPDDATLANAAQDALYDDVAHKQLLSSLHQVPSCSLSDGQHFFKKTDLWRVVETADMTRACQRKSCNTAP